MIFFVCVTFLWYKGLFDFFCLFVLGQFCVNKSGSQVQVQWLSVCVGVYCDVMRSYLEERNKVRSVFLFCFRGESNKLIELRLFLFSFYSSVSVKTVKTKNKRMRDFASFVLLFKSIFLVRLSSRFVSNLNEKIK